MLLKHHISRTIIFLLYPFVRTLFRPITKKYLTIFLFHEITNTPSDFQIANSNYTTVQNFQKNIRWIHENYEVVELSDLAKLKRNNTQPYAVITFDDAWQGQIWATKFMSEEYGMPVTLFLNIGTIISRIDIAALRSFEKIEVPSFNEFIKLPDAIEIINIEFLNWQGKIMSMSELLDINELANATFANHSLHHYPAIDLTEHEFLENVELNEKELSKLRSFKKYFAFPFGKPNIDFNDAHIKLLESKNYIYIFSGPGKSNKLPLEQKAILSRINFSPTDSKKSDFWWATNKNLILRRY